MTSTLLRVGIALAVVVALIGAVGLASADMNSNNTDDDERAGIADHMPGELVDHMDGNMIEQMQEHMGDHDHEDHHDGTEGHC